MTRLPPEDRFWFWLKFQNWGIYFERGHVRKLKVKSGYKSIFSENNWNNHDNTDMTIDKQKYPFLIEIKLYFDIF